MASKGRLFLDHLTGFAGPVLRPAGVVAVTTQHFSVSLGEDDGRETLDAVFLGKFGVGRLLFLGLSFRARKIEFKQNDVVLGPTLEFGGIEDFLFELDAPSAPVASGEVHEDGLPGGFRFFGGGVPGGVPTGFSHCASCKEE